MTIHVPGATLEEATDLLKRLIACDTSNPPGRETQAIAVLEQYLADAGVQCERIAADPDRANLLARLPGRGSGPSLAFLGHVDVVVTRREDWTVEPFAGIERDGVVWGRGAVDMKCQVAASAVALAVLAREGFQPAGELMLLAMADEEVATAGVGSAYVVKQRPGLRPDYVIGEGAGERFQTPAGPVYLLDCGVKASAKATLTTFGRAGDASIPGASPSALIELAHRLTRLDEHLFPERIPAILQPLLEVLGGDGATASQRLVHARAAHPGLDQILGALTRTVVHPTITGSPGPPNQIPDRASATLQCALTPGTTREELEAELRAALGDGRYQLEIDEPQGGPPSDPDSPLRDAIQAFLDDADPGARLLPALGYGYSDADVLRAAYGSTVYGFIPFRYADPMTNLTTKHGVDERVLVEDVHFQVRAALSMARAIGSGDRWAPTGIPTIVP